MTFVKKEFNNRENGDNYSLTMLFEILPIQNTLIHNLYFTIDYGNDVKENFKGAATLFVNDFWYIQTCELSGTMKQKISNSLKDSFGIGGSIN